MRSDPSLSDCCARGPPICHGARSRVRSTIMASARINRSEYSRSPLSSRETCWPLVPSRVASSSWLHLRWRRSALILLFSTNAGPFRDAIPRCAPLLRATTIATPARDRHYRGTIDKKRLRVKKRRHGSLRRKDPTLSCPERLAQGKNAVELSALINRASFLSFQIADWLSGVPAGLSGPRPPVEAMLRESAAVIQAGAVLLGPWLAL